MKTIFYKIYKKNLKKIFTFLKPPRVKSLGFLRDVNRLVVEDEVEVEGLEKTKSSDKKKFQFYKIKFYYFVHQIFLLFF